MIFKACHKVLSCEGQWGEEATSGSPDKGSNDVFSVKHHCDCNLRSYFRGYWGTDFTLPEEDKPCCQPLDGMIDVL
jgi:hypothetical protein